MPMFKPQKSPRIFGLPSGLDFPNAVVSGLIDRAQSMTPEEFAKVEVFVNTQRMQRRIKSLFADGTARLLPRIRVVSDLGHDLALPNIPPATSPLRRTLELAQLITKLVENDPEIAPKSSIFDLADSLSSLMDEMQGEGVKSDAIAALNVDDQSGHWQRSLQFISLVKAYLANDQLDAPDAEGRQRLVIEQLTQTWADTPPNHPIIIAGSTGSRGTTAMLMRAATMLPQGAIIFPGYDWETPWQHLEDPLSSEDHPQYRFAKFAQDLEISPNDVQLWSDVQPPNIARNRLVSLALRPAPVTDQWQIEGPNFQDVSKATKDVTLVQAKSPRQEALSVALILRDAVERNEPIALITPDRRLTRQVTAVLDRWGIEPDDSAGRPLALSAPGRLLRHVSDLFHTPLTSNSLLAILKHPLTHSGDDRGNHLRWSRDLELSLLRRNLPNPTPDALIAWAEKREGEPQIRDWVEWLTSCLFDHHCIAERPLSEWVAHHLDLSEAITSGVSRTSKGGLWDKAAGREALKHLSELQSEAEYGGSMTGKDFAKLLASILNRGEVRDPDAPHSGVMFWGTLEARVQGTKTVILAGLNEGTWPEVAAPDPWMNRKMRKDVGLLLPERRIGLAAHDFQQAIAADHVFLTRTQRNDESETVPSRWVNRLCNLLAGMSDEGAAALNDMRSRGEYWTKLACKMELPLETIPAELRPSPRPPLSARPSKLSVTAIKRLIRDPYAIYAASVLKLRALESLQQDPDAPLRGTILHNVLERFISERPDNEDVAASKTRLMKITDEVLTVEAPWPATRALWYAKMERVAEWFIEKETERQAFSDNVANEAHGTMVFDKLSFTLSGYADRIDRNHDGNLRIYDYKTGKPPTADVQMHFDKQLLLEAVIAEAGGFGDTLKGSVSHVAYIGLGSSPEVVEIPLSPAEIADIKAEFEQLIEAYTDPDQGYLSRRAMQQERFDGDFDHLARFGEWDESQLGSDERVGDES